MGDQHVSPVAAAPASGLRGGEAEPSAPAQVVLPLILPGHWSSTEGWDMAAEYAGWRRDNLGRPDLSDFALANAVYMADRRDLDLIVYQTAAKERIRWLSVQLALANMQIAQGAATIRKAFRILSDAEAHETARLLDARDVLAAALGNADASPIAASRGSPSPTHPQEAK